MVMGATNVPEAIDHAFLRPGRFDRVIYAGPPSLQERCRLLNQHRDRMANWLADNGDAGQDIRREPGDEVGGHGRESGGGGPSVDAIAEATEGWTGADIGHLCRAAALSALKRCLRGAASDVGAAGTGERSATKEVRIARADFERALATTRPSVSPELRRRYEEWRRNC